MSVTLDLRFQQFGRLWPIHRYRGKDIGKKQSSYYYCICECGNTSIVAVRDLTSGDSKSCGCLYQERFGSKNINFKHGQRLNKSRGSQTYKSWMGMLKRCYGSYDKRYSSYGGRGIKVCERWRDFKNFLEDMGERPEHYSIERINVNGDYEPSNCVWIPHSEQAKNRRYNKLDEFKARNIRKTLAFKRPKDLAKAYGVCLSTISAVKHNKVWKENK